MKILLVVAVLIIVLIGFLVSIYNTLVKLRNRYMNAFAQIDVQLKRRYDLIPNLVETAKGALKHERETLEAVIAARNQAANAATTAAQNPGDPGAMKGLMGAEGLLAGALGKMMVVVEKYPDLRANSTMSQLMEELSSTENRVAFARQAYNDSVTTYNTACESFPNVILAGSFGFKHAELFEIEDAVEREAVKVEM